MMNLSDPLDRLRAVNPVVLTDPTLSPPDPILFRRITSGTGDLPRLSRRRRRSRWVVPVLVTSSLLGGAAAYAFLQGRVSKPEKVACYESADLEANTEVASVDERGPIAACADLWRRGAFGPTREVPDLAECVLGSGVAAVFPTTPGHDVCRALELPSVAPSISTTSVPGALPRPESDDAARVRAFRDAVAAPFLEATCLEPPVATSIVRRELDRAGLRDWTIRAGEGPTGDGFTAQRPCASLSLRPEDKEVVLVPAPR